ncbi:hypothetical protein FSP39_006999, partial [Pinctada imbricata]
RLCITGTEFPPLTEGTLRLYSMRFCPYAQRTRLVLAHKNIQHETVNVHLKPEKPDWFLERNPLGLVPVLEKDGKIVYESTICNEYLDTVYPENKLLPSDHYQRALDDMLLAKFDKTVSGFFKFMMSRGKDEETYKACLQSLKTFEEAIQQRGQFFGGKDVGMLDFNMWPFFERFVISKVLLNKEFINNDLFPGLQAWTERMMEVPAVKACYFPPDTHVMYMLTHSTGVPDYDLGLYWTWFSKPYILVKILKVVSFSRQMFSWLMGGK